MSPRAAALGARGAFAFFCAVILGHLAFLGWAAPLGHPRVVLTTSLALIAFSALAILVAWYNLVRNRPWARFWAFAILVAYSFLVLVSLSEPALSPWLGWPVTPSHALLYLALIWAGTIAGTAMAHRAASADLS